MKKIIMVLITLTIIACKDVVYITEPKYITKTDTILVGMQRVNLVVDWSKFTTTSKLTSNFMANAVSDSALSITHVGARLVYPNSNAAFIQSTVKDGNNTKLITLQVPTTNNATLYVLAVHDFGNNKKALKMGVRHNINITTGGEVNLTLDSLDLIETNWYIDSLADTTLRFINDTVVARFPNPTTYCGQLCGIVRIKVLDPYQIGENSSTQTITQFYGTGYGYGNTSGWRQFGISVIKPVVGTYSIDKFWPYMDGSKFNLNGDYLIGKQGVIKTIW
jgi:hypothetical protein